MLFRSPIAETVGANRIVKAVAIPHPIGNPKLPKAQEERQRKEIIMKALETLGEKIDSTAIQR